VIDSAGQKLAYVYFEDEPGRAKLLSKDEARRIARRNHPQFPLISSYGVARLHYSTAKRL
jgi:hypothetical protein